MHALAFIAALAIIGSVLWEVFETIILPRRIQRKIRLTRFFYLGTWRPFRFVVQQIENRKFRDNLLGIFGPASLLILFGIWALSLIIGYGLLYWGIGAQLYYHEGLHPGFWADIYYSGTTFFTLGLGEVLPHSGLTRIFSVFEAGMGLGFLALVIAYLPTLYSAFSQREVNISLLDARAGSPSTAGELLRRHSLFGNLSQLDKLLADWEDWSAALMESHISYPVLCYFRSQHTNQSWIGALTAILDTCALVMTGIEGISAWQARLTFAICRHALVDINQLFHRAPIPLTEDRLPADQFLLLRENLESANVVFKETPEACSRLKQLRDMYEPYAFSLSELLMTPLPPWTKPEGAKDNWTTTAWKVGD